MLNILIVDDDCVDRMSIIRLLKEMEDIGFLEAHNLSEAIDLLSKKMFDCIILDYLLPDGTGLDLLQKLKDIDVCTPVIFITSKGDELMATKAIELGAQNYFPKDKMSCESDLFIKCIKTALDIKCCNVASQSLAKCKNIISHVHLITVGAA